MENNEINGYQFVDLGLRSGLLWATCNIGANKPHEYGQLFSWGESEIKEIYLPETSPLTYKEMEDISGDPKYDAASRQWGFPWRIPNRWELHELWNHLYGKWKWISDDKRKGLLGTATNGNSIFFPASGEKWGERLTGRGIDGCYWTSSPWNGDDIDEPASLVWAFCKEVISTNWNSRAHGFSIRPIANPKESVCKFPLKEMDVFDIYGASIKQ